MAGKGNTQHRSVRIGDEDWRDLGAVSASVDSDRGTVIKELVRWYLRRPDSELPDRPSEPRSSA